MAAKPSSQAVRLLVTLRAALGREEGSVGAGKRRGVLRPGRPQRGQGLPGPGQEDTGPAWLAPSPGCHAASSRLRVEGRTCSASSAGPGHLRPQACFLKGRRAGGGTAGSRQLQPPARLMGSGVCGGDPGPPPTVTQPARLGGLSPGPGPMPTSLGGQAIEPAAREAAFQIERAVCVIHALVVTGGEGLQHFFLGADAQFSWGSTDRHAALGGGRTRHGWLRPRLLPASSCPAEPQASPASGRILLLSKPPSPSSTLSPLPSPLPPCWSQPHTPWPPWPVPALPPPCHHPKQFQLLPMPRACFGGAGAHEPWDLLLGTITWHRLRTVRVAASDAALLMSPTVAVTAALRQADGDQAGVVPGAEARLRWGQGSREHR